MTDYGSAIIRSPVVKNAGWKRNREHELKMGMLHVTGHGKIQISLRLHRSPLRFIPNRLLSRETLQRGSIGIFLPFISPPTPRKPILQLKGGKFLPFFLILSVVYDHFIFHSGSRNWLSRIG